MPAPEPYAPVSALSADTLLEAAAMLPAFVAVLFLGSALLPGRRVTGPDADGERRVYKLNGLALFLIVAIAAGLAQVSGWFSLSMLHAHFAALFVVANAFAFVLSGWLFFQGARARKGSQVSRRDFFMGCRSRPDLARAGPEAFQLLPLAHRPRAVQRILRRRAIRDLWRADPRDGAVPSLHVPLRAQLLPVRTGDDPHLGHRQRALRMESGLGGLCAGAVLLLPPRLVAGARAGTACPPSPPPRSSCCSCSASGSSGARISKSTVSSATPMPRSGGSPRGPWTAAFWSPGSGVSDDISTTPARSASTSLSPSPRGLASWLPFLLPAWLAGLLWHRSRRDERPLPRQARRVVGTLHTAGALFDAAVRPLRAETTNRAQTVTTPQSARGSLRSGNAAPGLSGGWPLIGNPPEFQRDPVSMLSRG